MFNKVSIMATTHKSNRQPYYQDTHRHSHHHVIIMSASWRLPYYMYHDTHKHSHRHVSIMSASWRLPYYHDTHRHSHNHVIVMSATITVTIKHYMALSTQHDVYGSVQSYDLPKCITWQLNKSLIRPT
jgi:hypothetical protein